MREILLDGRSLKAAEVEAVSRGAKVRISEAALIKVKRSKELVCDLAQQNRPVYGISTGFGELSKVKVSPEDNGRLQRNLILSHACALGEPLDRSSVRAIILLRLNTLLSGFSGVSPEVVTNLAKFLNLDLCPLVPEKGSLGASGDLANLAHIALCLIGEGQLAEAGGPYRPAREILKKHGIDAITLSGKDGLAIINGTPLMAGLGILAWREAEALWHYANFAAALTFEAFRGISRALDPRIHELRPHPGQILTARLLRAYLAKSEYLDSRSDDVQDPYTLRCTPQVHGASYDAIEHVGRVLEIELNSVTDNPLVFPEAEDVISGGNFHGQPLALSLDYLAIAVSELANISERRIERLVNPQLSEGLPAFLVAHEGVNSGLMIPQYTAASLVSENKVLSHPASVDSIPSSANKEDHVSMGANAARKLRQIVWNSRQVIAIELLTAAQAIDLLPPAKLGAGTSLIYQAVREKVKFLAEDRILNEDIKALSEMLAERNFLEQIAADFPELEDLNRPSTLEKGS
ncbi:MAG: histidine ammonia-lyase [Eubacteriales bacterium]|nr:histidine ammonia-lyase [Eubacteriales bacterium]